MSSFLVNKDGSVEDTDGNIVFFSMERFVSDICEGNCCFMCGASPNEKEFNEEHIIPKWLLRKLDIFGLSITLPNNAKIRYDQYTVPCCEECNSFLGSEIEEKVRTVVNGGIASINSYIAKEGPWTLFLWLCLIFFKTHLKDSYLRKHLDKRKGEETISSDYDWSFLHHIHCLIRAIQSDIAISHDCLGTVLVLPAKQVNHIDNYDYRDVYAANTILLRIDDIAFLAVLDDSCASAHFFRGQLERIKGPLSPLQLREVLSHLTLLNFKLKYRPTYHTKFDSVSGNFFISAELPEKMELDNHTSEEFGEILYANVADFVENMPHNDSSFTEENVRRGFYHFLFDEKGNFLHHSMNLIDET